MGLLVANLGLFVFFWVRGRPYTRPGMQGRRVGSHFVPLLDSRTRWFQAELGNLAKSLIFWNLSIFAVMGTSVVEKEWNFLPCWVKPSGRILQGAVKERDASAWLASVDSRTWSQTPQPAALEFRPQLCPLPSGGLSVPVCKGGTELVSQGPCGIKCLNVRKVLSTAHSQLNESLSFFFFKDHYLFIFRENGEGNEKEGEKHQCVAASHVPHAGDPAHNPGMCPDWKLNWRPIGSQSGTQSTEPHQPGQHFCFCAQESKY